MQITEKSIVFALLRNKGKLRSLHSAYTVMYVLICIINVFFFYSRKQHTTLGHENCFKDRLANGSNSIICINSDIFCAENPSYRYQAWSERRLTAICFPYSNGRVSSAATDAKYGIRQ